MRRLTFSLIWTWQFRGPPYITKPRWYWLFQLLRIFFHSNYRFIYLPPPFPGSPLTSFAGLFVSVFTPCTEYCIAGAPMRLRHVRCGYAPVRYGLSAHNVSFGFLLSSAPSPSPSRSHFRTPVCHLWGCSLLLRVHACN